MLVVIDTNILVSALWSRNGAPARVVSMVPVSYTHLDVYKRQVWC